MWFVSAAHQEHDIAHTLEVVRAALLHVKRASL
jgi:glutamate-1-semialdehyde aminotransferase